ncbi:MAG: ribosome recycling factor [Candidatus Pacebacteria bacterium]|nr:ribosome recycling factor [Candidatus Paceibacterota bacterium]
MYDFTKLKEELKNIENWLSKELLNLRTGTASISILDDIKVESYGVDTPVNQMANITIEDAKNLKINPYDSSQIQDIEKAVTDADLGVAVSVDGSGIRLSFPDLTGERREELIKKAKTQLEQAKINERGERDKVWNDIQSKEKEGEISQDEKFVFKDQMQEIIDGGIKQLELLLEKKELDIRG